jgi:ATP-binding cassette subfamily C protein CydD
MGTLRVGFLSGSVLELAATLGVALVAVTVGVRLVDGGLGLRAALTVLILAPELYAPLRQLGAQFHASADGLAVADRMLGLLEVPPAVGTGGRLVPPSPAEAPVRLERVSFAYPSRPDLVLDELDLELLPGETLALVGASGTGKSTVASLLLRFADPLEGRITAGGLDLAECRTDVWRRLLAWVPQHPTVFRGTVADNIRLGAPRASAVKTREAAMLAGERRRIALARAFLRDAPLVILDEPTADLDRLSADVVAEAVERMRPGRTVLLIAHRSTLVHHADRVVSLDGGGTPFVRTNEAA